MLVIEGIAMCFVLLMVCVIGISNDPVGLVTFYEKDVQKRVVELGLTTNKRMKRNTILAGIGLFIPILVFVPYMVYGINGVTTFKEGCIEMLVILMIAGLFDRLFIDWYWVGHTKTWDIEGTEDLKPYINKKVFIRKWIGTLIGFPLLSVILAYIMTFFIK